MAFGKRVSAAIAAAALMAGGLGSSAAAAQETATAIFAGGCFWCVESDFDHVPGVTQTISGFTGGTLENPTYEQVSHGGTGHYEAVEITYDPAVVSYAALLDVYWHSVDPTDAGGQFCDRGDSYRTAIFAGNAEERALAEQSKIAVAADLQVDAEIVTPILEAQPFYPAEEYHQNYYLSDEPLPFSRFGFLVPKKEAYKGYRQGCGRDARLHKVWGDKALQGTVDYK